MGSHVIFAETGTNTITTTINKTAGGGVAVVGKVAKTGTQYSKHALERMAQRGITPKMAETAINKGAKFFDPKNASINHVIKNGFASGKDLLIATNPTTGQVTTVIRGTKLIRPRFISIH